MDVLNTGVKKILFTVSVSRILPNCSLTICKPEIEPYEVHVQFSITHHRGVVLYLRRRATEPLSPSVTLPIKFSVLCAAVGFTDNTDCYLPRCPIVSIATTSGRLHNLVSSYINGSLSGVQDLFVTTILLLPCLPNTPRVLSGQGIYYRPPTRDTTHSDFPISYRIMLDREVAFCMCVCPRPVLNTSHDADEENYKNWN